MNGICCNNDQPTGIIYANCIRSNSPISFLYTFRNGQNQIINLIGYVSTSMEIKKLGCNSSTFPGILNAPLGQGQVSSSYTFPCQGTYIAQFYVVDPLGNKTYGVPIQITVSPNADDLKCTQLPVC